MSSSSEIFIDERKIAEDIESLCQAGRLGMIGKVGKLLEKGVVVNGRDTKGITALHWACAFRHPETIEALVSGGADINAKNSAGYTPLHNACLPGHVDVACYLIHKGANLFELNVNGKSPIDLLNQAYGSKVTEAQTEEQMEVLKDAWSRRPTSVRRTVH